MTIRFSKKHLCKNASSALKSWIPGSITEVNRVRLLSCMSFLSDDFGKERFPTFIPYHFSPHPFDPRSFHAAASIVFDLRKNRRRVEKFVESWFSCLPISREEEIYLTKRPGGVLGSWAAATTWKDFRSDIWREITGGFETLCVFDDTFRWIVLYGPESCFVYAEAGPVNTELSQRDNANGWDLKRIKHQPNKPPWDFGNFTQIHLNLFPCECQGPCEDRCLCSEDRE